MFVVYFFSDKNYGILETQVSPVLAIGGIDNDFIICKLRARARSAFVNTFKNTLSVLFLDKNRFLCLCRLFFKKKLEPVLPQRFPTARRRRLFRAPVFGAASY